MLKKTKQNKKAKEKTTKNYKERRERRRRRRKKIPFNLISRSYATISKYNYFEFFFVAFIIHTHIVAFFAPCFQLPKRKTTKNISFKLNYFLIENSNLFLFFLIYTYIYILIIQRKAPFTLLRKRMKTSILCDSTQLRQSILLLF